MLKYDIRAMELLMLLLTVVANLSVVISVPLSILIQKTKLIIWYINE